MPAGSAASRYQSRLVASLVVNLAVFGVEVAGGLLAGSLALLADAGHLFVDAVAVGLSIAAVWMAQRPTTPERSFGYYRLEILAAVINAVLLFGVGIFIAVEAVRRLVNPSDVASGVMLAFGLIGLVGNGAAAWLLRTGQGEAVTIRSAFLDFLADALGGAAVVVAAIVIAATGFHRTDSIASLGIAVLIFPRTWKLLRQTVDILLEATPKNVDMAEVRRHIAETPGVAASHDLHAWSITSGMNVLSAHVVLEPDADGPQVLDRLAECLCDHFDIEHSTFQLEPSTHESHERSIHP